MMSADPMAGTAEPRLSDAGLLRACRVGQLQRDEGSLPRNRESHTRRYQGSSRSRCRSRRVGQPAPTERHHLSAQAIRPGSQSGHRNGGMPKGYKFKNKDVPEHPKGMFWDTTMVRPEGPEPPTDQG